MDDRNFDIYATCLTEETRLDVFGVSGFQITEIREDRIPREKLLYASGSPPDELDDQRAENLLVADAFSDAIAFFRREIVETGYATREEIERVVLSTDSQHAAFTWDDIIDTTSGVFRFSEAEIEPVRRYAEVDGVRLTGHWCPEEVEAKKQLRVQMSAIKDQRFAAEKSGGRWRGKSSYYDDQLNPDYPLPLDE